jgi:hypothetical protein
MLWIGDEPQGCLDSVVERADRAGAVGEQILVGM